MFALYVTFFVAALASMAALALRPADDRPVATLLNATGGIWADVDDPAPSDPRTDPIGALAQAMAGNLEVWHQAAIQFRAANPGLAGDVALGNLTAFLPASWHQIGTYHTHAFADGRVVTWIDTASMTAATEDQSRAAAAIAEVLFRDIRGGEVGISTAGGTQVSYPQFNFSNGAAAVTGVGLPATAAPFIVTRVGS